MNFEPGSVIDGKYRIVRLLGSGGMGAVYEGENLRIKRRVAIKLLHANVSSQAEAVQRFEREAQAAGRIGSEHICEVLDLGTLADGTRFLVMEYLDGENLSSRIQRAGRLGPAQSIPLVAQILEGLSAAHLAGIIHRDLKPDNIWILPQLGGTRDFVKILDFGVSKFSQLGGEDSMSVTRAGAVVGTPYYMSPEQARGMSQIDQRSDIYAIGVLLYQATTGQVPFQAETFNELLFKIVLEPPQPATTYVPDLDPEFGVLIGRAMAREPGHRYQSCQEFKDALLTYQRVRLGQATGSSPPGKGVHGTMMLDGGLPMAASQARAPGPQVQSGVGWAPSASGVSPPAAQQAAPMPATPGMTSQSWGNASGADPIPKPPKSKAGLWIAVVAGAAVLGIVGVASAMLLGGGKTEKGTTESASTTQPTASPSPTVVATTAATTTPTAEPVASAVPSATPSAAPTAVASATPSVEPKVAGKLPASKPSKPAPATPTTAKPTSKPAPGSNDFGY